MEFEWDEAKAARNARTHGVEFLEAVTSFFDPLARLMADEEHSVEEERFVLLGRSEKGRVLATVFTEGGPATRIISVRRATRRERRAYEEGI